MAYIMPYITSWGHLLLCTWSYCDLDFGSLSKAYQEIQEFTGYNACTVPEINWVLVGFRWFETPQCCDKFFIEINNKIKYIFFLKISFPKLLSNSGLEDSLRISNSWVRTPLEFLKVLPFQKFLKHSFGSNIVKFK